MQSLSDHSDIDNSAIPIVPRVIHTHGAYGIVTDKGDGMLWRAEESKQTTISDIPSSGNFMQNVRSKGNIQTRKGDTAEDPFCLLTGETKRPKVSKRKKTAKVGVFNGATI